MNHSPSDTQKTENSNRFSGNGPFQSKVMKKFSEVIGKVEDGTQTLRKTGLTRLSSVMREFANRVEELNNNLDLNAPLREKALASSKKREQRAAEFENDGSSYGVKLDGVKPESVKKDASSEQSPKAPAKSGAV